MDRKRWIGWGVAGLTVVALVFLYFFPLSQHGTGWRALLAAVIGLGALVAANLAIFPAGTRTRTMSARDPELVGLVIAFDAVIFIVAGLVLAAAACPRWEAAMFCGGACLLAGGLLGLLFGMPISSEGGNSAQATAGARAEEAAQTAAAKRANAVNKPTDAAAQQDADAAEEEAKKARAAVTRAASQTLLAQSASWASKLLAGAGLARFKDVRDVFFSVARATSAYVDPAAGNSIVFGSALVLYFLLVGFLSGLFLPAYFMRGWQD